MPKERPPDPHGSLRIHRPFVMMWACTRIRVLREGQPRREAETQSHGSLVKRETAGLPRGEPLTQTYRVSLAQVNKKPLKERTLRGVEHTEQAHTLEGKPVTILNYRLPAVL